MIALLVQNQFPTGELVRAFREEEVEPVICRWAHTLLGLPLPHNINHAALITLACEIDAIGERITEARLLLGNETYLLVCAPALTEKERLILSKCGADSIITPRSHAPEHFAERIAAELFMQGIRESSFGLIRGATRHMRQLYSEIKTVAIHKYPVLILGETGTGKDLIAGEIHRYSDRPGQFLKINCAELSRDLLRSELFGHARGSFTGAFQAQEGLMLKADEGTLFLDEIGDLGIEAQAMLLQVLEDYTFRAVGGSKLNRLNARLVLATHRNLEHLIEQGKFRQDLFARIYDFTLNAPPLREHRADIPLLVHHFIDSFNQKNPGHQVKIPAGALDCLFESEWPDNVRQLLKAVQKAAVYKDIDGNISVAHLLNEVSKLRHRRAPASLDSGSFNTISGPVHTVGFDPATDSIHSAVRKMQKAYIEAQLELTQGNKEKAIENSGIRRSRFYELLRELEIK